MKPARTNPTHACEACAPRRRTPATQHKQWATDLDGPDPRLWLCAPHATAAAAYQGTALSTLTRDGMLRKIR